MSKTLTVAEHTEAHAGKVKGYKKLTPVQIAAINIIKEEGVVLQSLIDSLIDEAALEVDLRWLAEGRTDLQKGLMSLTRAVAQPDFF